jgi:DNA-binding MarR family transcriptional regulator
MKFYQEIQVLREVFRRFNRRAGVLKSDPYGLGLSLSQGSALVDLERHGSLRPNDLVALLGLEKSSISRLITVLEKKKLLRIQRQAQDGRSKLLRLTPHGHRTAQRINAIADRSVSEPFAKLTAKEQKQTVKVFERWTEILGPSSKLS